MGWEVPGQDRFIRATSISPSTTDTVIPRNSRGMVRKARKIFNKKMNQMKFLHGSLLFVFSMSVYLPPPPHPHPHTHTHTHTNTLSNRVLWTSPSGYEADFEPPPLVDGCRWQKRCVQITSCTDRLYLTVRTVHPGDFHFSLTVTAYPTSDSK